MTTLDKIRNGLIDKILSIKNKDFLVALDKFYKKFESEINGIALKRQSSSRFTMRQPKMSHGEVMTIIVFFTSQQHVVLSIIRKSMGLDPQ